MCKKFPDWHERASRWRVIPRICGKRVRLARRDLDVQDVTAIGGPGNAQRVQYQVILKTKSGRIKHRLPSFLNPEVLGDAPGLVTRTRLTILAGDGG